MLPLSKSDPAIAEARKILVEFNLAATRGDVEEMKSKNEELQRLLQRVRQEKQGE